LKVIFTFPSGFVFGVVTPLNFIHVDLSSTGKTNIFLQDTDWSLAVGQVVVEVNRVLVNFFESFGFAGGVKAFA
jgi:hypothetical protein